MTTQDKVAIFFGIGLNLVVATIVLATSTGYIA